MSRFVRVFGPPGTGKTEKLLSLMLKHCSSAEDIKNVAFCSFTRRGTLEGVMRAKKFFRVKEHPKFFRTLHSLAFKALELKPSQIISSQDRFELTRLLGVDFVTDLTSENWCFKDKHYITALNLYENNRSLFYRFCKDLDMDKLKFIAKNYKLYKDFYKKLDFNDILREALAKNCEIPVKVAFIDEAQDLSPLQIELAKNLFRSADTIFLAGDDDQAIYTWAGASSETFLSLDAANVYLTKSYRLNEAVLKKALEVIGLIEKRAKKEIEASLTLKGEILFCNSWEEVNKFISKSLENFLILTRTTKQAKEAYEFFSKIGWNCAFLQNKVASNKLTQSEKCQILFSTIHSAKGSECENVVVACELSNKITANFDKNFDDELRVLYVALTRTKGNLYIKLSPKEQSYNKFLI